MAIRSEHVGTRKGEGTVLAGSGSYSVEYQLEEFQEVKSYVSGGAEGALVAYRVLEGHLYFIDGDSPAILPSGEMILKLEDGRQLRIMFPDLAAKGEVRFLVNGGE